eukprot:m.532067 g.532067  ORF g.532067 m.532067 type:complete len:146 (+) comp22041_c1_seq24:1817-2254(+)
MADWKMHARAGAGLSWLRIFARYGGKSPFFADSQINRAPVKELPLAWHRAVTPRQRFENNEEMYLDRHVLLVMREVQCSNGTGRTHNTTISQSAAPQQGTTVPPRRWTRLCTEAEPPARRGPGQWHQSRWQTLAPTRPSPHRRSD